MRVLQLGAHVVSGTPGRVFDMIQRKALLTLHVRLLVIDEADEMLAGEFRSQLYELYRYLPPGQVVLASATLPRAVLALSERFMRSPLHLLVRRERLALDCVRQFFIELGEEKWKLQTLCDLYERFTVTQSVVFLNSRERVEELGAALAERGFAVCAIHGGLPQREREKAAAEFRAGEFRVLLATDVWARGLDVQQVSLVLNYDFPSSKAQYLHRAGRAGRFGRRGVAVSFLVEGELKRLEEFARFFGTRVEEMPATLDEAL